MSVTAAVGFRAAGVAAGLKASGQPDVALVVLAIRWTSHSYGVVKAYCDQYGKPFVRLKAGYNPTQVAAHILDQVSDQLPSSKPQSESA